MVTDYHIELVKIIIALKLVDVSITRVHLMTLIIS